QVITQKFKTQATATGLVTTSDLVKVEEQCRDAEIAVMGNGALPNSHGLRKIRAKRAAELDAYRKLLERLMGVEVTSETKVKKFILESDVIAARAAAWVKGAKPVKIEYADDDSCEVTMQIKVADIFRVIKKYDKSTDTYRRELTKLETEYATTTFTETGSGAPQPRSSDARILEAAVPRTEQQAMVEPFKETSIVVKQLVGQRVVLE
ncbi:MAG: hypothetical protein N2689_15005, partial [Verrucomicrobiae bacterium]|nr:hypothetical protein [Verrucomicrobiae bacterium]